MKLLGIDIGNTNITMGLFDPSQMTLSTVSKVPFPSLISTWRLRTQIGRTPEEHFAAIHDFLSWQKCPVNEIKAIILCSVVPPLTDTVVEMANRFFETNPLVVSGDIRLGVKNAYQPPEAVGADRLVNAVTAIHFYGTPCIIVDFGTATTFDAITADGTYLGGAIAPGIMTASEALFQHTAQLPRIALTKPKNEIGQTTTESLQSGLVFGYVGLVKELVRRFQKNLGKAKVVATGGLAHLIAPLTEVISEVNLDLTVLGLAVIWSQNQ